MNYKLFAMSLFAVFLIGSAFAGPTYGKDRTVIDVEAEKSEYSTQEKDREVVGDPPGSYDRDMKDRLEEKDPGDAIKDGFEYNFFVDRADDETNETLDVTNFENFSVREDTTWNEISDKDEARSSENSLLWWISGAFLIVIIFMLILMIYVHYSH